MYSLWWNARLGEVLYCERELNNAADEFAVAVKLQDLSGTTMGHIPRKLSKLTWHFIRQGGRLCAELRDQCRAKTAMVGNPIIKLEDKK